MMARDNRPDVTFYTCREEALPAEEQPPIDNQISHPNVTFDINHYTTALCID